MAVGVLACVNSVEAQFDWVTDSDLGQEHLGASVSVSEDGLSYVTGHFEVEIDFGNGVSLQAPTPMRAGFVAMFEPGGVCGWAALLASNVGDVQGIDLVAEPSGSEVTVVGSYSGDMDAFSANNGPSISAPSLGGRDLFVARYDGQGSVQGLMFAGGAQDDEALSVALDTQLNVCVTGYFTGGMDVFDANGAQMGSMPQGNADPNGFVFCVDPSMTNPLWMTRMRNAGRSEGTGIATDGGDLVYVTGSFHNGIFFLEDGPGQFDGGSFTLTPSTFRSSLFGSDAFVVCYKYGTVLWSAGLSSLADIESLDIATMQLEDWNAYDGTCAITGEFRDTFRLDSSAVSGAGSQLIANPTLGSNDRKGFVASLDPTGAFTWANTWNYPGSGMGGPNDGCAGHGVSYLGKGSDIVGVTGQLDHMVWIKDEGGATQAIIGSGDDIEGVALFFLALGGSGGDLTSAQQFGMNFNNPAGLTFDFGAGIDGSANGWVITGAHESSCAQFPPFALSCGAPIGSPRFFLAQYNQ